jgi:hypothetical protein
MTFFASLPHDAGVRHILGLNPRAGRALIEFHTAVLRQDTALAYARKLTREPSKMVAADARAVFAAGWTERDLHDAVLTIGLFNLMNRLPEGHGVKGQDHLYKDRGAALARDGYAPLLAKLTAAGDADSASQAQ